MNTPLLSRLFLLAALCAGPLPAQSVADRQSMDAARQYREGLVSDVVGGKDQSEGALARLKTRKQSSGLNLDDDTDQALAAMDIGQRLLAAGKPTAAELFFREAEKSLDKVIRNTPDSAAQLKGMLLQKRALLREHFLGKAPEAEADLAQAAVLQPDDKALQSKRDLLRDRKPGVSRNQPKK